LISNVILISDDKNSHINRWLKLLKNNYAQVLFFNTKKTPIDEIRKYIKSNFSTTNTIIISGPIDSVSLRINLRQYSHFLLSFGYDIQLHLNKIRGLLVEVCESKSGGIIVDSSVNEDRLMNLGLDANKVYSIPWGVEEHWLQRDQMNKKFNEAPVIISPRRHEEIYRIEMVIRIFFIFHQINPKSRLILLGNGSQTNKIMKQINSLKLDKFVKVFGKVSEDKYLRLLSSADFYLSATEVDGTSVSLLQAMSMGVIPIISDIPANQPWVSDGVTGFKFPLNSSDYTLKRLVKSILISNHKKISLNCITIIQIKAQWNKNSIALIKFLSQNF